ncbi:RagB/SusD family nutrient uptake outer membrane protein [Muricauda sp. SCSIO 64092]|uniref:RagB/SusD family nutrient uptake outer membrane protein n=1 Tax=Allomuricauda sp. SCSIO 64092 TaxID=2908842 RepID=UPI001FF67154|nr:RagB/SusD family nutrient uptake outer membrane protein [Muricauda sp. SCSIO 64092]UOY04897.1 RagB/SusD family nutrient uptake outer membrane protein [Muricauda sp. SCSIO 64092]
MNIKKVNFIRTMIAFGLLWTLGCNDDFLEKEPIGQLSTAFTSTDDAILALNAAYSSLTAIETWNAYDPISEMWSGDTRANPDLVVLNQIRDYTLQPDNSVVQLAWNNTYEAVYRANIVINSLPDVEGDEALKARLIGEAQFIRGAMMMRLVNFWGTAPLITELLSPDELNVSNSTPEALWQQVIDDFTAASAVLPNSYEGSDVGRATRGAALGFLGKAHLFNGQWQSAADQFALVEGLSYSLLDNFADVFLIDNSQESVFEIQFAAGLDPSLGSHQNTILPPNGSGFGAGGGWGFLQPFQESVDAYEDGDIREGATFFVDGDSFEDVEFPENSQAIWPIGLAKYTRGTNIAEDGDLLDGPHNWIWMRYADVLLMHAEALIELNRVGEALDRINQVRQRAGLPNLTGLSQDEARDAVRLERRLELYFEGARGLDIRRWGIVGDVASETNFTPGTHEVLPIPQVELDVNPELNQNVGY